MWELGLAKDFGYTTGVSLQIRDPKLDDALLREKKNLIQGLAGLPLPLFSLALISEREINQTSKQEAVRGQLHFTRDPAYLGASHGRFCAP